VTVQKAAAQQNEQHQNELRLDLNPVGTGIYPDRLSLSSSSEVRIIDVEIDARQLGQTHALTAHVQARQEVTQNIPVVNISDKPMTVTAKVSLLATRVVSAC
jgi:hypothetical protein